MTSAPPNIGGAGWLRQPETQAVFAALDRDGHIARAVGGAVRNTLMGLATSDIDLATTAPPDLVVEFARAAGLTSVPTGLKHGTVTIIADHHPFEVTTLREDVNTYGRHADVAFTDDWAADARRRDFTINALYCGADGTIYDPLGGYPDIVHRRVRFIGKPEDRIREDYLRILRFYRFSAEYVPAGKFDAAGHAACIVAREGLRNLSGERIRAELLRLLGAREAESIVSIMAESGVLAAIGIASPPDAPAHANLTRILCRLALGKDPLLQLGALWVTDRESVAQLTARLKLSGQEQTRLQALAAGYPPIDWQMPEQAAKLALYRMGEAAFRDRVLFEWARGTQTDQEAAAWREWLRLPERWQAPVFLLKGADVVANGVKAGPDVGAMLREIEDEWIEGGFAADRATLLERLRIMASRTNG
ncbi:MAG: hypothetical protein RLZ98_379 [Pseudomonadota bacterium]|jgi:poly(A) polymerase